MQAALLGAGIMLSQAPLALAQSTAAAERNVDKTAKPASSSTTVKPTPAVPVGDTTHNGDLAPNASAAKPATPAMPAMPVMEAAADQPANDATLTGVVGGASKGPATLRAQVLLERANFSPGELDGASGSNMTRAIRGYQSAHGLTVTGSVDAATWAALNKDSAPVLARYTTTAEDVAGPFNPIPTDMMEKSKLPRLDYTSALEGLAEKFHASPKLLQQLNPGATFTAAGEVLSVPNVGGNAAIGAVDHVVVDRSESTVALVDAGGKLLAQFPASTGSQHDPLPVGDWKIQGVAKDPSFNYNPELFWDANPEHGKAKIPAGPNNPVGVVWIDLSKEHYGIHGTPEPSRIGKTQSHGCIRLTNWSARLVASQVKPGMTAKLQE
jgi:lipoprotein-anchoring transpeptidase ErfK/SrfK